ncbi:MAG: helix-turn-helix domain-containing protein [Ruminococcus sp.]|nr:helix-turn-helix domain-containing protein [Ruminococcus sp.]
MNFNDIQPKDYTKTTFGECIRARREELKRSVRDVAKAIQMSPVYLSDIERGLRVAPTGANKRINYMDNLIRELKISEGERNAFFTMAEATTGRFSDISSYLSTSHSARVALRLAKEAELSEDEWQKFIDHIRELQTSK